MHVNTLFHQLPKKLGAFVVLASYYVLRVPAFVLAPAVPLLLGVQTIPPTARCLRPLTSSTVTDNPTLADASHSEGRCIENATASDAIARTREQAVARMQESHLRAAQTTMTPPLVSPTLVSASDWRRLAGFSETPSTQPSRAARPTTAFPPRAMGDTVQRIPSRVSSTRKTWNAAHTFEPQPRHQSASRIEARNPANRKAPVERTVGVTVVTTPTDRNQERPTKRQFTRVSPLDPPMESKLIPVVLSDRARALRQQPKNPEEEARLAARYGAIKDIGERAFAILCDLEMIRISPNPNESGYDSSADHELNEGAVLAGYPHVS